MLLPIKLSEGVELRSGYDDETLDIPINDDIYLDEKYQKIPTGICINIPNGYTGLILPRSSTALKYGIEIVTGTIDPGYTGELMIVARRVFDGMVSIPKGTRIAHILFIPVSAPRLNHVTSFENTKRKEHGFGSTGD